jgi:hypothetical protein
LKQTRFFYLCVAVILALTVVACGANPPAPSDPITTALSASDRAKQAEALRNVRTLMKGQQAHYVEKNKFSSTLGELNSYLGVAVADSSGAYEYGIKAEGKQTMVTATSREPNLKSYSAMVLVDPSFQDLRYITCETNSAGQPAIPPVEQGGSLQCAEGSSPAMD